jgi:hypothetical protein
MAVTTFTLPYVNTPPYFSGSAVSTLVPNVFPVAIDGRPYMVDQKSGKFQRGYEQRVRDSQDGSTTPGEGAINPGGLWRRGQDSWHAGAGQQYADINESAPYRFYKSKGVNPWIKGQLSLLPATKLSLSNASTTQHMVVCGTRLYVALNGDVKFTTNPFATSPTWTAVVDEAGGTAAATGTVGAMATDGNNVYLAYPSDGIRQVIPSTNPAIISNTKFVTGSESFTMLGFAKNYMFGAHDHDLHLISATGTKSLVIEPDDTAFRFVGIATGQNAVYAAGFSGKKSLVYKITIKADGTLDKGVVALELPTGEVVTTISGYLGFILLGTNKGVRYCSTDANSNLISGQLIPTSGAVQKFASNEKFAYFTWSNYDGTSGGLGALDLSVFSSANTPAFATDLMYTTTADINSVVVFADPVTPYATKRVFAVSGIGIVVEDADNLVASGEIETGTWRWGIPDRKFVAKIDTRSTPLVGSIVSYLKLDDGAYLEIGTWDSQNDIENTFNGSDDRAIEASFKFTLNRSATTTGTGPTFTRWMARAYVSPFRSQVFSIPIMLHKSVTVRNKEYYYDVDEQQTFFDGLIESPRIVTLQIGSFSHNVILEDIVWEPADSTGNTWTFDGTLVVTLRSVEN